MLVLAPCHARSGTPLLDKSPKFELGPNVPENNNAQSKTNSNNGRAETIVMLARSRSAFSNHLTLGEQRKDHISFWRCSHAPQAYFSRRFANDSYEAGNYSYQ